MKLLMAPVKERRSWTTDSRRWTHYRPRPDDIVIGTSAKCGTTWMQQIVSLLIFQSPEPRSIQEISPWIDFRVPPVEETMANVEAQTHRRFVKTHLEFDAIPVYDAVRYIHVARDGRDAFMSWYNHARHYTPAAIERYNAAARADDTIGRPMPIPGESIREFFGVWMTDGPEARLATDFPAQRYLDIEKSYWGERRLPNLLMVHYSDLKADLEGEMRRIAAFLGIDVPEGKWAEMVQAAGFESMRAHGATLLPRAAAAWDKGSERFLNAGVNGRWRDVLTDDDVALYQARARRDLSPNLARWLEEGSRVTGDPRTLSG